MTDEEIIEQQNAYYMAGYPSRRSEKKMTKDEMKNRISMALKDPILQQGFECICKENAELKEKLKPENCLKLLAKGGYVKFTNDQLTKAKEIIKDLLDTQYRLDPYLEVFKARIKRAEDFISGVSY